MSHTRSRFLLLVLNLAIFPCMALSPELYDGRIENNVYINPGLGWKISIPPGWTVNTMEEIARIEGIGQNAIKKTYGEQIPPCHTPLIYLTRDHYNRFTSTVQMFDPKSDGNYRENQDTLFAVIIETFRDQGLKISHSRSKEILGNLPFETLNITMFSPDGKRIVLQQIVFDTLINDRSLTLSLLYNNEQHKEVMLQAMKKSIFGKPEAIALPRPPGCIGI